MNSMHPDMTLTLLHWDGLPSNRNHPNTHGRATALHREKAIPCVTTLDRSLTLLFQPESESSTCGLQHEEGPNLQCGARVEHRTMSGMGERNLLRPRLTLHFLRPPGLRELGRGLLVGGCLQLAL